MKIILRIGSLAACLIAVLQFIAGAGRPSSATEVDAQPAHKHLSGLMANIIMSDGATRTVKLEGVGCPQSMCSRTAIKAKTKKDSLVTTWFDSLAAIRDTTATDALFVLKDGTSQRMSLVNDFRVLYLANHHGGPEKLDVGTVKSVEFVRPAGSAR